MGLKSLLLGGKATPSPYSSSSQTSLPDWYTNYAMQVLSNQNAVSNTPYATYQGPRVAGFNGDDTNAFSLTRDAATGYQGALSGAANTIDGVNPGGALSATSGLINRAGGKFTDNVNEYMNPYNDLVVDRIGQLGTRNLMENILPGSMTSSSVPDRSVVRGRPRYQAAPFAIQSPRLQRSKGRLWRRAMGRQPTSMALMRTGRQERQDSWRASSDRTTIWLCLRLGLLALSRSRRSSRTLRVRARSRASARNSATWSRRTTIQPMRTSSASRATRRRRSTP